MDSDHHGSQIHHGNQLHPTSDEHHHHGNHSCCEGSVESQHQAYFSFITDTTLLLQQWTASTVTGVALGAIVGIILSIALESVKCYMFVHKLTFVYNQIPCTRTKLSIAHRIVGSVLHMLHVLTGYVLMLLVMSYNAWILIAVVFGAGLGHFFIRPVLLRMVQLKVFRYLRKHTPVRVMQGCPCKRPAQDLSQETLGQQDYSQVLMEEECNCCEEQVDQHADQIADGASSADGECEKPAFTLWDPIRQSRQYQVKGIETSV